MAQDEGPGRSWLGLGVEDWAAVGVGAAAAVGVALLARSRMSAGPTGEVVELDGLESAPFPGQQGPDAVAIIPPDFRPWPSLRVWVYARGFGNCSRNVVGDADSYCTAGGRRRAASRLASQLARSGANALVVVPELRYDAASSEPGALARPGGLAALLDEVLARLEPRIGRWSSSSIDRLGVMSHSGGYLTCAAMVESGHPALRSVVLLDSLYGADDRFARWVEANAGGMSPRGGYRFADVFTRNGGTADRSYALADRVAPAIERAGNAQSMLYDPSAGTLSAADYGRLAVLFKYSALDHTEVTRYYPERFWAAGW